MRQAINGPAVLAALLVAAAPAAAQTPQADTPGESILVTGERLQDFRDRLRECVARRCPTNEDVDASLTLAEALFVQGEYEEGRSVVRASLDRNRRQARTFPEPVSDLYRAQSRFARHIGRDQEALRASHGILSALQDGIPQEDHRHFTARLELAEMHMMMRDFRSASGELVRLARIARAVGREDVATLAELKRLWYFYLAYPHGPAMNEDRKRVA
jgi:hypothetical protein